MASNATRKTGANASKDNTDKVIKKYNNKRSSTLTTESLEKSFNKFMKDYGATPVRKNNNKFKPNLSTSRESLNNIDDNQKASHSRDKDGWEFPKNPKKIKITPNSLNNDPNNCNTFNVLVNNNEEEDVMDTEEPPEATPAPNSENNQNQDTQQDNSATTKSPRAPPIHVTNSEIRDIINLLTNDNNIHKGEFKLKQVNASDTKTITIFSNNLESHKKILETLELNNKKYYTYTPKTIKPKSIILKGANGGFTAEMVKEELQSMNLTNVEIIKLNEIIFNKNKQRNENIFLVQVSHNSDLHELTKIKLLLHQVVRWEHLKREKIFQCKRCQRLGHASTNCKLEFRCVKCSENHGPNACKLKSTDPKSSLKCANCGQQGHPANYRGCIYYKHALNIIKKNDNEKNQKNKTQLRQISRFIDPNIPFNMITKNQNLTYQLPPQQYQYQHTQMNHNQGQQGDNHQGATSSTTTPQWVIELKNEFKLISNKLITLETLISQNSNRIDQLFELVGEQFNYE